MSTGSSLGGRHRAALVRVVAALVRVVEALVWVVPRGPVSVAGAAFGEAWVGVGEPVSGSVAGRCGCSPTVRCVEVVLGVPIMVRVVAVLVYG